MEKKEIIEKKSAQQTEIDFFSHGQSSVTVKYSGLEVAGDKKGGKELAGTFRQAGRQTSSQGRQPGGQSNAFPSFLCHFGRRRKTPPQRNKIWTTDKK